MITKEQVKAAYAKIRYAPDDGYWKHCFEETCCPVTALVLSGPKPDWEPGNDYDDFESNITEASKLLDISKKMLRGIVFGFDDMDYNSERQDKFGYDLGQELRRELL